LLHDAQAVEGTDLPVEVAEVAVQRQGLVEGSGGGRVVPGQLLHPAQEVKGGCLRGAVADVAG
jgi:hypothetical protein